MAFSHYIRDKQIDLFCTDSNIENFFTWHWGKVNAKLLKQYGNFDRNSIGGFILDEAIKKEEDIETEGTFPLFSFLRHLDTRERVSVLGESLLESLEEDSSYFLTESELLFIKKVSERNNPDSIEDRELRLFFKAFWPSERYEQWVLLC